MKQKSIKEYEILENIGRGAQGSVVKVLKKDGNIRAVKIVPALAGTPRFDAVKNEIDILIRLTKSYCHPNIVCYYDYFYDPEEANILIEMEYIDGDTLTEYMNKVRNNPAKKNFVTRYLSLILKDLAKGLSYIHSKNILHNDIKSENIMIDKSLTPKFIDFGLGCVAHDTCSVGKYKEMCCGKGVIGTFAYSPPEVFSTEHTQRYPQSDVWSLGVSMYEAATGKYPFDYTKTSSVRTIMNAIVEDEPKVLYDNPVTTDDRILSNLIKFMLAKKPEDRNNGHELKDMLRVIPQ